MDSRNRSFPRKVEIHHKDEHIRGDDNLHGRPRSGERKKLKKANLEGADRLDSCHRSHENLVRTKTAKIR
jgi:hypothetical protein